MGDDTHVTDVGGLVHESTDLVCMQKLALMIGFRHSSRLLTDCEVTTMIKDDIDIEQRLLRFERDCTHTMAANFYRG